MCKNVIADESQRERNRFDHGGRFDSCQSEKRLNAFARAKGCSQSSQAPGWPWLCRPDTQKGRHSDCPFIARNKPARLLPLAAMVLRWLVRTLTSANSARNEKAVQRHKHGNRQQFAKQSPSADPNAAQSFSAIRAKARGNITNISSEAAQTRPADASQSGAATAYQLDLVTPGINPCEASSRKVRRDILNRRMKARRRPLTSQRFTTREGLASRGSCASPA